jgi:haloacetate dehalogenase
MIVTTPVAGAASPARLPGFEYQRIDVEGVTINCAVRGSGPPLLLLHGYPQNHLAWRHVAPALAENHTVVLADLRGYGDSGKPARTRPDSCTPSGPWPGTR